VSIGARDAGPRELRALSEQMSVPLPRRTEFLSELQGDLDAFTTRLIDEGLSRDEAWTRANEALLPDGETLDRLERLHASGYRRLTARVDDRALRRLERAGLAVMMGLVVASGAALLVEAGALRNASTFLWPVLTMGAFLSAASLTKAFQLWIKGDHDERRRGLRYLLFLSGGTLLIGTAGVFRDVISLLGTLEQTPNLASEILLSGLVRETTLMAVSLLIAMAGTAFWLAANQWIAHVEDAHERALGMDSTVLQEKHDV
jgi:hypothetical protein